MPEGVFRAGNFELRQLVLVGSSGVEVDLSAAVINIPHFESIGQYAITGQMIVQDSVNLSSILPVIGQEYLKMQLATPTVRDKNQMIDFTQNAMMVTSIDEKMEIGNGAVAQTINFCSREMLMNERVRIISSLTGSCSSIVEQVLTSDVGLQSRKKLFFEPSSENKKIVAPNIKPFGIIKQCEIEARSNRFSDPCYLFFETTKGFSFRSLASLYAEPSIITYEQFIQGTKTQKGSVSFEEDIRGILAYNIVESQDSLFTNQVGTYGSTLYTHDIVGKGFQKHIYNYLDNFNNEHHIESTNSEFNGQKKEDFPVISSSIITKDQKRLSDFNGKTFVAPINGRGSDISQQNDFGLYPFTAREPQNTVQVRNSQMSQLNSGFMVNLEVHGNTAIAAGDVIDVNLPFTAAATTTRNETFDPLYKGKFIISKLRHDFLFSDKTHSINMQVVKDSLNEVLPSGDNPEIIKDGGPEFHEIGF